MDWPKHKAIGMHFERGRCEFCFSYPSGNSSG